MAPISLFFGAPAPVNPVQHQLKVIADEGVLGGPSYCYRGAVIDCMKGGHMYRLALSEHPLSGMSFGVAGTITPLVDLWFDAGRLPDYMRASPKLGR